MILRYLAALCLLLVTAAASADSHGEWCRRALGALPTYHEDRGVDGKAEQLDQIASAVAGVSRGKPLPPREWSALIFAVGLHESGFSMRIVANNCKPHECDRGRARGFGQNHSNSRNRSDWRDAPGNVELQAKLVSDALTSAYWTCKRSGVEPVRGTLSAYAGQRCGAEWRGLDARMATLGRLVAR